MTVLDVEQKGKSNLLRFRENFFNELLNYKLDTSEDFKEVERCMKQTL